MFADRREAGQRLATELAGRELPDPLVLGLPRGGVEVAAPVAETLHAPLDVLLVRKLGAPTNPEFGLGAVGEGDVVVVDERSLRALGLRRADLDEIIARERAELHRRHERYRGGDAPIERAGRTVIVVDDGLATGVTAAAAGRALRADKAAPERTILALPVASRQGLEHVAPHFDEVLVLGVPDHFLAVGTWYGDFAQTSDEEVVALLDAARERVR